MIELTSSDHDEGAPFEFTGSITQLNFVATDHLSATACCNEKVSVNDGRDVEHAIEISD